MIAFTAGGLHDLGWTGWVLAFMYTACAALRLARFNVSPARWHGRFEGLPSPAAAGMVVASVWLAGFLEKSGSLARAAVDPARSRRRDARAPDGEPGPLPQLQGGALPGGTTGRRS